MSVGRHCGIARREGEAITERAVEPTAGEMTIEEALGEHAGDRHVRKSLQDRPQYGVRSTW